MRIVTRVTLALMLVAVAVVLLVRFSPALQDRILGEAVWQGVSRKPPQVAGKDEMQVLLCGTSAPPPSLARAKSCTAISAGGRIFLVDVGPGSVNKLSDWRFPLKDVTAVLLTHYHSDHIGDLGELRMQSWVSGRAHPLPLYGPTGIADVAAGFNRAYAADASYRAPEHHLDLVAVDFAPHDFGLAEPAQRATHMADRVIYDRDGLRITAFQVIHEPVWPAVGYRFDYRGRSVVVSGDTAVSANLVAHARNADLLIHEAQSPDDQRLLVDAFRRNGEKHMADVMSVVKNYHASPVQVAQEANEAGVRLLVLNHMGPIAPDNLLTEWVFERGMAKVRPASKWKLGYDGMVLALPVGSSTIRTGSLG